MKDLVRANRAYMKGLLILCAFVGFASLSSTRAAEFEATYTTVDFLSEVESLPSNGGQVTLGLYLKPHPKWHAYWKNPGDAGLAAKVTWDIPQGFEISELQFPTPHLIPFGPMNTYGYEEPILLLAEMKVPGGLENGSQVSIEGKASWVVCDDKTCVPDRADIKLDLVVGDGALNTNTSERFVVARSKLPELVNWPATFSSQGKKVYIQIDNPEAAGAFSEVYLFPAAKKIVKYDDQTVAFTPDGITVVMNADKDVQGKTELPLVLSYLDAGVPAAVELTAVFKESAVANIASSPTPAAGKSGGLNPFIAILFAFLGGVALNAMPCVFPILSMKALGLVSATHGDKKIAHQSGLIYTGGILLAFAVIGAVLVALRAGGQAVGWGFQMQYPLVNLGLGLLMVAVAVNLFGIFEFGTRLMGVGSGLTYGGERRKAFFTGLLAVVVATPCTAPFMAPALGFALTQPSVISMAVFISLGAGLAAPYLLLSYAPGMASILPKPGAWMDTFKKVLAFPMLATALWLFWVLGKQAGTNSFAIAIGAALLLGFALWAYGQSVGSERKRTWQAVAIMGVLALGFSAYLVDAFRVSESSGSPGEVHTLGGLTLEPFTPERVEAYVSGNQPTFVYFTADWCISCKANERVALATDAVANAFAKKGIKVVEGDWTSQNPVITEWLQRYGRIGVPLYLYFPPGSTLETPVILPQILTPDIVISATS